MYCVQTPVHAQPTAHRRLQAEAASRPPELTYNQRFASLGLPWWLRRERRCLQCRRCGFDPWVGKIPWRRERLLTPVFLPGESHGQRSLAGCSPWGHRELDPTAGTWHALKHLLFPRPTATSVAPAVDFLLCLLPAVICNPDLLRKSRDLQLVSSPGILDCGFLLGWRKREDGRDGKWQR